MGSLDGSPLRISGEPPSAVPPSALAPPALHRVAWCRLGVEGGGVAAGTRLFLLYSGNSQWAAQQNGNTETTIMAFPFVLKA